jgi:prevent-host-death family protein
MLRKYKVSKARVDCHVVTGVWAGYDYVMSIPSLSNELGRIDEPQIAGDYAAVLSEVAAAHRPIIVRRNGKDLAAVVPLEHLELISEGLAQQEAEKLAAQIDWERAPTNLRPPQSWIEDEEDDPFQPEGMSAR